MDDTPKRRGFLGWWRRKPERDPMMAATRLDPALMQAMLAQAVVDDLMRERRSNRRWRIARRVLFALLISCVIAMYASLLAPPSASRLFLSEEKTLGLVRIEGQIRSSGKASADKVIPALRDAFEDPRIKKVVIVVDSPGGSPVEAERIGTEIDVLRKQYKKPVYAAVGNLGASAGYLVAMHADRVYAAKYSLVGSIGAVLSAWNAQKAINRLDIYQNVYASGDLKGMLNPFSEPSERAGEKAQELVNVAGGQFLADLKTRRAGKLKAGVDYGTGEVWNGVMAKEIGLVDELGTLETIAAADKAEYVDFGPGKKNSTFPAIGALLQEWTTGVMSTAVRDALEGISVPELE